MIARLGLPEFIGDLAGGVARFVEGGGRGLAEGVGADPGELVRVGRLGCRLDLGLEGWGLVEVDSIGPDEVGHHALVDLDTAGFDEFDSGSRPGEGFGEDGVVEADAGGVPRA
jgi:hypothetical protein